MRYRVVTTYLMYLLFVPSLAQEFTARVVNGTAEAGRLEIFHDGTWNTVCDDSFGQEEALVACRMLGLNSTTAAAVGTAKYGAGSGPILFSGLQCVGNETSLAQCQYSGLYRHNCEHRQDVGVACITQQMSARVVGGTADAGRLEILYDGTWGTVCNDGFGLEEALVACRMLGFNSTTAVAIGSAKYGSGSGPILFSHLRCVGDETSLAQCEHSGLYRLYCEHWQDVGVMCNITTPMTARLYGGTSNAGRLEISVNGEWTTVCEEGFGQNEVEVACRMLGLNSTGQAAVKYLLLNDGLRFQFGYMGCQGMETNLQQCYLGQLNKSSCLDVGIISDFENFSLRLTGPRRTDSNMGRVEVEIGSKQFSTVCVNNEKTAAVICRQLKLTPDRAALIDGWFFGQDSRPLLQATFVCEGTESSLDDCVRNNIAKKCYSNDVGISCSKSFYKPLITITWTNNTGEQQSLSSLSELNPGHNVTLWCKADSNPLPASITWSGRVNSTTGELRILAADHVTHSGVYTCTVVTGTVDDDDRLPLTSSYELTLSVEG
ncbi:scavenger receptor cysteine-rich type 1 protein M130-like isoform X2 [Pomacea canaliculata]|uniref:scavenger receptor cysteine-rich type 1 protein M130-like isoform X2 n=1 Tax=Pomacea canaliculata TaxID=400727 RepID=UPI000D732A82|nr:scavenger receptor cysteine-rich type 1 protein M130-like isoform X2 [Pomacea canaliculata]